MTDPRQHLGARNTQSAALTLAAAIMLVPANVLPVLSTNTTGQPREDTIFSGIVSLWQDGMWAIAAIVFIASILIPLLKLVGLSWLLFAVRHGGPRHPRRLSRIYLVLDRIGRWSMLDVFLAAFLSGVVRFGVLASVEPRRGIVAFAIAVVLTVLATDAFDSRLLWADRDPHPEPAPAT
jgi:paraquat-inducible protein A